MADGDTSGKDRPEELEASVLPAREAMSLISPDGSQSLFPALDAVPSSPDEVGIDAQGSQSGEASVSSDDRSEHITNRDTATSET